MHRPVRTGVLIAAAAALWLATAPARGGALDLREGDKVRELYGVEIVGLESGRLLYRLHAELDAGTDRLHQVPIGRVVRIKDRDAATFTHAEWQRTDLLNPRMAEDGYRQTLREVRDGRSARWSAAAALVRLVDLLLEQERYEEAAACAEQLAAAGAGDPAAWVPSADLTTCDPARYDAGVRAVQDALRRAGDGPAGPALAVLARRLVFRGPAVLRAGSFLGIDDSARRVAFVLSREGPAENPTARAAVVSAVRRMAPGREFAVYFGAERALPPERRVGMSALPVRTDAHDPARMISVAADPRVIWDPLAAPAGPQSGLADGLQAALTVKGAGEDAARPDAVFLVVAGGAIDRPAIEAAVARCWRAAGGPAIHVVRIPAAGEPADAGTDDADRFWKLLAARCGGEFRRFTAPEWARNSTCR
jgi:hypothetical protein